MIIKIDSPGDSMSDRKHGGKENLRDKLAAALEEIKEKERQLALEREKCRFFVGTVPEVIYQIDNKGNFVFVNEAVSSYGFTPGELIGRHISTIIDPEDWPKVEFNLRERRAGDRKTRNVEIRLFSKSNISHDFEVSSTALTGGTFLLSSEGLYLDDSESGQEYIGSLGIARDISERKEAERKRLESEKRISSFMNELTDAFYYLDHDLCFLDVNRRGLDIIGLPKEEVLGKKLEDIVPDSRVHGHIEYYKEVLETGKTFVKESTFDHERFGELYVIRKAFRIGSGLGIISIDISDRHRMEQLIRKSEERYKAILNSAGDPFYLVDTNMMFVDVNTSACEMLGYSREELLTMGIMDIDASKAKTELDIFHDNISRGYSSALETLHKRKDGSLVPVEMRVNKALIDGVEHIIGIARDVTEKRAAADNLSYSLSLIKATLEATEDGILATDLEGRFIDFNKRFQQIWRCSDDLAEKMRNLNVITPEVPDQRLYDMLDTLKDMPAFVTRVRELYAEPEADAFDIIEFKDGRIFERHSHPQYLNGKPVGRVWSYRDVTEARTMAARLASEHGQLQLLMKTSPVGISFVNADGVIIQTNDMAERILEASHEEIQNTAYFNPPWKVSDYDGKTFPKDLMPFSLVRDRRKPVFDIRFAITPKGGERKLLSVNAMPLMDDNGEFMGMVSSFEDVTERVTVEQSLRENEEFLQRIFDSSLMIMSLTDMEHRLVMINSGFTHFTGYTEKEVLGRTTEDIGLWDNIDERAEYVRIMQEQRTVSGYETKFRIKSGDFTYGHLSSSIMNYKGQPHVLTIAHDIKPQKESELALKESEERFRNIFDQSPLGIHMYRLDENGELIFTAANPAADRILGFDHTPRVGKTLADAFPGHDSLVIERYLETAKSGDVWNDTITTYKNGQIDRAYSYTAFRTTPGAMVSMFMDITERMKYEEEKEKLSGLLYAAIEQSPVGLLIADAPDVNIQLVNSSALAIRGETDKVLSGIGVDKHLNWDVRYLDGTPVDPPDLPLSKAVLKGETTHDDRLIIMRDSGEARHVLVSAAPVKNSRGEVNAGVVVILDITDAINTEQKQHQLESQLRQSQKMESIGRLAGGIAHDFNNLLTVIIGTSELALSELTEGYPFFEDFTEIKQTAERAAELTRQLLGFSRRQIIAPTVMNLNDNILSMDRMLRRLITENIEFVVLPGDDLWPVKMDGGQLQQVLTNLVVNARDAMPEGGTMSVKTDNVFIDESFVNRYGEIEPGQYVKIHVSDNGVGIDKNTIDHIFEPFFTTKATGEGTGLGLSTCYGIMKQNKGAIFVDSEAGKGTTVSCYFPRVEDAEHTQQETPEHHDSSGTETILLVEDEPSLRNIVHKTLALRGYTVHTASHGEEGIHAAIEQQGKIDLLITDVIMPRMGGKELSRQIKSIFPDIRILFMSGYTDSAIVDHGILEDGVEFIQKPFTPMALLKKVRDILD